MAEMELRSRIKLVLAEVFQVPLKEIRDDLIFGDLPQWDSMGHMDVMMSLEEHFGVEVTAENIGGLTSLEAILAHLEGDGNVVRNDHAR
jgi:acyl carrier protein